MTVWLLYVLFKYPIHKLCDCIASWLICSLTGHWIVWHKNWEVYLKQCRLVIRQSECLIACHAWSMIGWIIIIFTLLLKLWGVWHNGYQNDWEVCWFIVNCHVYKLHILCLYCLISKCCSCHFTMFKLLEILHQWASCLICNYVFINLIFVLAVGVKHLRVLSDFAAQLAFNSFVWKIDVW